MKRSTVILLITVLTATPILFSHAHADMLIGVKGGLTASGFWGDGAGGPDMKGGFLGGVFCSYMTQGKFLMFENFGIQTELLFHRKGVKEVIMGVDHTWNLDYLEIPILYKVEIPPSSDFSKGFLLIGPSFAFTLNSKQKTEYLGESEEVDVGDMTKNFDIGFVLGLNANFDVGLVDVVIDFRHTLGIMTVDDASDEPVRNHALSLMAGVAIPF